MNIDSPLLRWQIPKNDLIGDFENIVGSFAESLTAYEGNNRTLLIQQCAQQAVDEILGKKPWTSPEGFIAYLTFNEEQTTTFPAPVLVFMADMRGKYDQRSFETNITAELNLLSPDTREALLDAVRLLEFYRRRELILTKFRVLLGETISRHITPDRQEESIETEQGPKGRSNAALSDAIALFDPANIHSPLAVSRYQGGKEWPGDLPGKFE